MVSYSDRYVGITAIASFLFGYQMAVLNTSLVFFTLQFNACGDFFTYRCSAAKEWESLTSSMVFIGATIGSLAAGYIVSKGRRFGLLVAHSISIVGSIVCVLAYNFPILLAGRAISGICVGIITVAAPSMISEMCPAKIRGSRGTMHQLAVTLGICVAVGLGLFMTQPPELPDPTYIIPEFERRWIRFMQCLPGILSVLTLGLMLFLFKDDTPQALLGRGRASIARKVLEKVYTDPDEAEERFEELRAQVHEEADGRRSKQGILTAVKHPGVTRALVVGCILSFGQQAGGINAFVSRSTKIFQDSGMATSLTTQMSTIMTAVNVIMTFPAIFLIDSFGRKPLLMIGVAGQAICLSLVPIVSLLGKSTAIAAVVSIIGFIVFFAIAYGPVLWVYLFEIYPPEVKGVATGLASALNWVTGSVVVYLNGMFSEEYNVANFTVFASVCWAILIFTIFFMKETKGSTHSPFIKDGTDDERQQLRI